MRQGFYGQEINLTTYNLARINMFLHDVNYESFSIAHGDTLTDPQHWDEEPFEASALPYSAHELENARHAYDLPEVHHTFLRASLGQCGVGGDDTWGAPVLPEYTVKNETKHFSFYFKGI